MSGLSTSVHSLLHSLGRDLLKFEIMCKRRENNSDDFPPARDYMWGVTKTQDGPQSEVEHANESGLLLRHFSNETMKDQTAIKLKNLLDKIRELVGDEKNTPKAPLITSLLVPSIRSIVEILITKIRKNYSNEHEIDLLLSITTLFGVKCVFPSSLQSANIYWTDETNSSKETANASTIEYFCMNDLLKLIIVQGHGQRQSQNRDSIIKASFSMLQHCLESIHSPLHQKKMGRFFERSYCGSMSFENIIFRPDYFIK